MSIWPKDSTVKLTESDMSFSIVISAFLKTTFSPNSSARLAPFSSDLPTITTLAPSSENNLAVSAPIPLVPPVIKATFPSSLEAILFPFLKLIKIKFS